MAKISSTPSTTQPTTTKVEIAESTWRTVLTQKQQDRITEMRKDGAKVVVVKCLVCGKYLVREKTVELGLGDYCDTLVEMGWTPEKFKAHRATMSAAAAPEGMIKLAELGKICEAKNIPVSRLVRAIGGDRVIMGAPVRPEFAPVYVKGTRWVSDFCGSPEGLKVIEACKGNPGGKTKTAAKLG